MAMFYSINKENYYNELNKQYFESEDFADYYMSSLRSEIYKLIHNDNKNYISGEEDIRIYYTTTRGNEFSYLKNCNFVIRYLPRNKVYTNIGYPSLYSIEEMKRYLENQPGKKLSILKGEIEADTNILEYTWENYKNTFIGEYYYSENEYYKELDDYGKEILDIYTGAIINAEKSEVLTDSSETIYNKKPSSSITNAEDVVYVKYGIEDFEIYMTYEEQFNLGSYATYIVGILDVLQNYENAIYISVPICGVLAAVIVIYLIMSIGYKKGKEGVDLNDIDKIPIEILIFVIAFIIVLVAILVDNFYGTQTIYYKLYLSAIITEYLVIYVLFAIGATSIIKRIKAKTIIKNSITYKVLKLCQKLLIKLKKGLDTFTERVNITWKIIGYTIVYILLMLFVIAIFNGVNGFTLIIDIGITIYIFYQIMQRVNCFKKIEEMLKEIYEGNNKERLDEESFTKEFKQMVNYINDISNGFENAVEEGIKSERLKTELITNVSHDIKTPLTSIINYVDLIKRENIENEKLKEYIEILEAKSHRLKRLTEDLVEASKASSGNVKLNLEKLNIGELINQTTGEFEDKFKDKNLEIIADIPKEEIFIEADSRYMYRVIENIFSNVSKYALKGSRVYVDVLEKSNKVKIEVKNISEQKLNISESELMQRFVRGDKSRTTEGSGLRTFNIKKPYKLTGRGV